MGEELESEKGERQEIEGRVLEVDQVRLALVIGDDLADGRGSTLVVGRDRRLDERPVGDLAARDGFCGDRCRQWEAEKDVVGRLEGRGGGSRERPPGSGCLCAALLSDRTQAGLGTTGRTAPDEKENQRVEHGEGPQDHLQFRRGGPSVGADHERLDPRRRCITGARARITGAPGPQEGGRRGRGGRSGGF